jgi:hypothetical protein
MRVTGDPTAPREINSRISPQAEEAILHAMQRNPADRYPTVAALRAELDEPEKIHVTGLSGRLQAPHFRLSLEGTPFLAGGLMVLGFLLLASVMVFLVVHHSAAHAGLPGR